MKLVLFSKYRTQIMGAAMMWIMFSHSVYFGPGGIGLIIHNIGIFGVDMFLMVSGLGIYRSLRRSRSVGEFYKKRAIRILPAYFIISIGWYVFFKSGYSFGEIFMAISGINYFRGTTKDIYEFFDWFIPFLAVLYLLTPLYDRIFQKVESKWKLTVLASMISPILAIIAVLTSRQVLFYSICRIPIYLIGYCMGWFLYERKEEKKGSWMVFVPLLFVGSVLTYLVQTYMNTFNVKWGLNTYLALLIAPGLSMLLAFIFMYIEKWLKTVGKILLFPFYICGRYSLEIYLLHQRLLDSFDTYEFSSFKNGVVSLIGEKQYYWMVALMSIAVGALIHEVIALVIRKINDSKKKERIVNEPVTSNNNE